MGNRERESDDIEYIIPKNYDIKPKILGIIEQEAFILFLIITLIIFMVINSIIENKYSINYNFHEFSSKLVFTLSENDNKLNEIFKKIFKTFMNDKFQNILNQSILEYYKEIANVSDKDITSLTSKTYTYAYVENAPYEIKSKEKIKGINAEILENFTKITGIDIKYVKYNKVADLKKAIEDKKAVLLSNHGMIAIGKNLTEAYNIAENVEFCSELFCISKSIGSPKILDKEEMLNIIERFKDYGKRIEEHEEI